MLSVPKMTGIEWEIGPDGERTGRWRRRQFYATVNDRRPPSERKPCEWRTGKPR
jgi:hypothetical protein